MIFILNYFSKVVSSMSKFLSNTFLTKLLWAQSCPSHLHGLQEYNLDQQQVILELAGTGSTRPVVSFYSFSQNPHLKTPATKTLPLKPNAEGIIISGFFPHCTSAFANALNEVIQ